MNFVRAGRAKNTSIVTDLLFDTPD